MVIIIAAGVGAAVLLFLLSLIVCCCVWRCRRRTWKADFVRSNHSADHKPSSSADIELGKVTYKQTQPTSKGMLVCLLNQVSLATILCYMKFFCQLCGECLVSVHT